MHLDPVGGIAGDMFVAAMLAAFPQCIAPCLDDLRDSGVLEHVKVDLEDGKSAGLAVKRFNVQHLSDKPRATGLYRDLVRLLESSQLQSAVLNRSLELLRTLAEAESQVHGVDIDNVHFHEVADWDSVTDLVAAASIIEHAQVYSWSCAPLPTGSGLVSTEHGMLPIPAPATVALLAGMATWDDGLPGERVTPTGAAIVKYLSSISVGNFETRGAGRIATTGAGAGTRELPDRPNILRCTSILLNPVAPVDARCVLPSAPFTHKVDVVVQLSFAIDDMTSEELSVALQHIRQSTGVIDVCHAISYGKKGRMMFDVTVLCEPHMEPQISRMCFAETSTLGMRVQQLVRRVLEREEFRYEDEQGSTGVKRVVRPHAESSQEHTTLKVEDDDLRRVAGLAQRRNRSARVAREVSPSKNSKPKV